MKKFAFNTIGVLILIFSNILAKAEYSQNEINLHGPWAFSIGDNSDWAKASFNDSNWETIRVPARWEEEGFQGYNGFAWYRKNVDIPVNFQNRVIILELGYIDDVDEVYLNGEKIGQTGAFPPNYSTAYNSFRKYIIPNALVNYNGSNVIAVRVYDSQLEGGIVRGNVRLVAGEVVIQPDIDLNGTWNFSAGMRGGNEAKILVPGQWENQGYFNYDGFAVYSRHVDVSVAMSKKKLIFLAGRIDDDDEFYVNGVLVAATGDLKNRNNTNMHLEKRNYFIPEGLIKPGKNLLEIKVLDRGGEGGILEGPVGIITQENFIKYWQSARQR
ncbi:MAG: beta galactosidase jelly roll domain-containing protein [Prolixibacteraceae bacterium]|nr:beta galactosidase jelly roll domain-containing protein [Prolixibacteraceae bacterium]